MFVNFCTAFPEELQRRGDNLIGRDLSKQAQDRRGMKLPLTGQTEFSPDALPQIYRPNHIQLT